jgi:hypothetical protein
MGDALVIEMSIGRHVLSMRGAADGQLIREDCHNSVNALSFRCSDLHLGDALALK